MSTDDKFASITIDGAILMGNLFCCDGHSYDRKYFAFSHMHSDHTEKLSKCLYTGQVFLTKPTRDLLEAINDENYGSDPENRTIKTNIRTLDYKKSEIVSHNGVKEKITFYPSEHVLGASQVEIITETNKKIVYSGDITSNDIPPEKIHTLIIDSTHGHPQYSKYSEPESVERRFLDKIDAVIHSDKAQSVVIHAHQGKLQEIISIISQHTELNNFPLHTSAKNIRIAKIYKNYGFKIRNDLLDEQSLEAEEQRDSSDWPFIQFLTSFYKMSYEKNGKAYSIFLYDSLLSGQQIDDSESNSTKYATTAHADFENIIKYVNDAKPKYVIVDNYRTKQALALTGTLQSKGFTAEYQPPI